MVIFLVDLVVVFFIVMADGGGMARGGGADNGGWVVLFFFAENIFVGGWLYITSAKMEMPSTIIIFADGANVRLQKSCIFICLKVQAVWMAVSKNRFGMVVKMFFF